MSSSTQTDANLWHDYPTETVSWYMIRNLLSLAPRALCLLCVLVILGAAYSASAQSLATIQDPDGWTNFREDASRTAKVLGRLDNGSQILVHTSQPNEGWHHITTLDGRSGHVHSTRMRILGRNGAVQTSRIQAQPTADLPRMTYNDAAVARVVRGNATEYGTEDQGRTEGKRYTDTIMAGYRNKGTAAGLEKILEPGTAMDGAVATGHDHVLWAVMHGWGDSAFATAVEGLPTEKRTWVAEALRVDGGESNVPIERPRAYLKKYFPKTASAVGK